LSIPLPSTTPREERKVKQEKINLAEDDVISTEQLFSRKSAIDNETIPFAFFLPASPYEWQDFDVKNYEKSSRGGKECLYHFVPTQAPLHWMWNQL
jgi:hypothetical protein